MHKHILLLTLISLVVVFSACKKSSNNAAPIIVTINPVAYPGYADTIWGIMECDSKYEFGGRSSYGSDNILPHDTTNYAFASFANDSGIITGAGNVLCNGASLIQSSPFLDPNNFYFTGYQLPQFNYINKAMSSFGNNISWQVSGFGTIPAISYNFSAVFPQYLDTIATSLTRSAGFSVPLGANAIGADSASISVIYFYEGFDVVHFLILATATSSALDPMITLTPSQLSALPFDTTCSLMFTLYKKNIQKSGGKNYVFITKYIMFYDTFAVY